MPRLIRPRTFVCLWLLLCLLLAGTFLAWMTTMPVYVAGPAIVVKQGMQASPDGDDIAVAVFLPARYQSELREGQALHLQVNESGERVSRPIQWIAPEILSPTEAHARFGLSEGASQLVTHPAVVIGTTLEPRNMLSASAYEGSVYRADAQVGSRRLLSLLSKGE